MQQVGRDWRDTINGSGKLLRKMGLAPIDDVFYSSPLPTHGRGNPGGALPGMEYVPEGGESSWWTPYTGEYTTDLNPMSNQWHLQLMFDVPTPNLGSRCRAMLACHPPPEQISLVAECIEYERRYGGGRHEQKVELVDEKSNGRMTMGRRIETVIDVLKDSRCDLPTGHYVPCVRVRLSMTLVNDDPIILERHRRMDSAVEWSEGKKRRRRRSAAKGRADFDSGSDFEEVSSVE